MAPGILWRLSREPWLFPDSTIVLSDRYWAVQEEEAPSPLQRSSGEHTPGLGRAYSEGQGHEGGGKLVGGGPIGQFALIPYIPCVSPYTHCVDPIYPLCPGTHCAEPHFLRVPN